MAEAPIPAPPPGPPVGAPPTAAVPEAGIPGATVAALTFGRWATNVANRMVFPFLPALARGLGASPEALAAALSVREGTGLAMPLLGRRYEARPRQGMVTGLVGVIVALAVAAVFRSLVAFAVAMVAAGLFKGAYDLAVGGWVARHVPYQRRSRIMGVVETSWAAALLVGMPLVGLAIAVGGWRAGLAVPLVLSAASLVLVLRVVPADPATDPATGPAAGGETRAHRGGDEAELAGDPDRTRAHRRERRAIWRRAGGLFGALALACLATQLVLVVQGLWLEDNFGISTAGIGVAAISVGAAELVATGSSALFSDRLGKRRSALIGAVPMIAALAALGAAEAHLVAGLAALAVAIGGFELLFVSSLPLVVELVPEAPAETLGSAVLCFTLSRGIGTLVAPWCYEWAGMGGTGVIAAVVGLGALGCFVTLVHEPPTHRPNPLEPRGTTS